MGEVNVLIFLILFYSLLLFLHTIFFGFCHTATTHQDYCNIKKWILMGVGGQVVSFEQRNEKKEATVPELD